MTPSPLLDRGVTCPAAEAAPLVVYVYNTETLWHHTSNPIALAAIRTLATSYGWQLREVTPADITASSLNEADIVAMVLSSGDALSSEQRAAWQAFVERGGGLVGVHSASFTEPSWPVMTEMLGARFRTHPAIQPGTILKRPGNPYLTAGLPQSWARTDEWYSFEHQPADVPGLSVVLELVEPLDYPADAKMGIHPIAWRKTYGAGRVFYTAMGHTDASYSEPPFLELLARSIEWAGAPARGRRHCKP